MAESGKRADWTYRVMMAAMGAITVYMVNRAAEKIDELTSLPAQVRQLSADQVKLAGTVEGIMKAQAGNATAADLQGLTGRVDTLTGRVDTMETTVNSLIKPVTPRLPK